MKVNKGKKQYRDNIKLKLIGENIRKYRIAKRITQNDLAFSCGDKDWSQISRMERGLVNFSVSYLFLVAEILEIKPEDLFSNT